MFGNWGITYIWQFLVLPFMESSLSTSRVFSNVFLVKSVNFWSLICKLDISVWMYPGFWDSAYIIEFLLLPYKENLIPPVGHFLAAIYWSVNCMS